MDYIDYADDSASQKERIEMLRGVLAEKVGVDSLAHYGVTIDGNKEGAVNGEAGTGESNEGLHL